jgi:hypothetical protein
VSSNISYTRQFSHKDWIDFVDSIQAGGRNGVKSRMHAIEQEFDTISGVVGQLNAGLGAFQLVGTAGAVAYAGGNVGIGASFAPATPPTYRLEVNLNANTAQTEQVRFGNAVCCNGSAGAFAGYAVFSQTGHASDTGYALRQGPNGDVDLNAAADRPIRFRQNGMTIRFAVSSNGNVIVGSSTALPDPSDTPGMTQKIFQATAAGAVAAVATFSLNDFSDPYQFTITPRATQNGAAPRLSKDQYDDLLNVLDACHPLGVAGLTRQLRGFVHGFRRPARWDRLPTSQTYPRYRGAT